MHNMIKSSNVLEATASALVAATVVMANWGDLITRRMIRTSVAGRGGGTKRIYRC